MNDVKPSPVRRLVKETLFPCIMLSLALGCATSSIESRRAEKLATYNSLPPEQKQLVDQGLIKIGMPADAVYISWGPPSEVLESEDPAAGHVITWRYYGSWMQETRYWAYRETSQNRQDLTLERYLVSDYNPRDYIRAEILLKDGKVLSWRTLPRPTP
jgi:hypothetical protein